MTLICQISLYGDAFDARKLSFEEASKLSGCKRDENWLDPIHKRKMLIGEFGCAVSHLKVWEKIERSNMNGIILEEDAVFSSINVSEVDKLLEENDSVWLGYRLNSLGYWYNCHAYAITPRTAKTLIDGFSDAIIPVDEWVPLKLKNEKNFFYMPEIVTQISRDARPSTIEGEEEVINFYIVTVATEPEKMWALEQSAKRQNIKITNLGEDHPWRDSMTTLGGMPKIQLVNEYLATVNEQDIVLFMDGYDTFLADSPQTILERFIQMDADIVFGAESECWPLPENASLWPDTGTPYRYLNSGLYIGKVKALHDFISQSQDGSSNNDDQLYCQNRYLNNKTPWKVKLDTEAYIFQNHEPNIRVVENQLWNDKTGCCGCIYHGNGGDDAKSFFIDMAKNFTLVPVSELVDP